MGRALILAAVIGGCGPAGSAAEGQGHGGSGGTGGDAAEGTEGEGSTTGTDGGDTSGGEVAGGCAEDVVDRSRREVLHCGPLQASTVEAVVPSTPWVEPYQGMAKVVGERLLVAQIRDEDVESESGWMESVRRSTVSFVDLETGATQSMTWELPADVTVEAMIDSPWGTLVVAPPLRASNEGGVFRLEDDGALTTLLPLGSDVDEGLLDIVGQHPIVSHDEGLLVHAAIPGCEISHPVRIAADGTWDATDFFVPAFAEFDDAFFGLSFVRGEPACELNCPTPTEALRLSRFDPAAQTASTVGDVCTSERDPNLAGSTLYSIGSNDEGIFIVDAGVLALVTYDGRRRDLAGSLVEDGPWSWSAEANAILVDDHVVFLMERDTDVALGRVAVTGGPIAVYATFDPALDPSLATADAAVAFVAHRVVADVTHQILSRVDLPPAG